MHVRRFGMVVFGVALTLASGVAWGQARGGALEVAEGSRAQVASAPVAQAPEDAARPGAAGLGIGESAVEGEAPFKFTGLLQPRLRLDRVEGQTSEVIEVTRARVGVQGDAYGLASFQVQVAADRGQVSLLDGWLELTLEPEWLALRVGQFIRPMTREGLTPIWKVEFLDRSLFQRTTGPMRELGVMLHSDGLGRPGFNWALGVFDGQSATARFQGKVQVEPDTGLGEVTGGGFSNVPGTMAPEVVAWVGWHQKGADPFNQVDLKGGPLRLSATLAMSASFADSPEGGDAVVTQADVMARAYGATLTLGAFGVSARQGPAFDSQEAARFGGAATLGYLLHERFEPLVRAVVVEPVGNGESARELVVGVGVLIQGQPVKWTTEVASTDVRSDGERQSTLSVRSHLSLSF